MTKYATLTDACQALRNAGYRHNFAIQRWVDAAGNQAETYRGEVTLAWYIRDAH